MNIIFGSAVEELRKKFVVLELDTFVKSNGERHTVHCLVENIPLEDFSLLDFYVTAHHDLMQAYRQRDWQYCRHAIAGLHGRWGGEVDTFYDDLLQRVAAFEISEPDTSWDGSRAVATVDVDISASRDQ
jgi:hypothetical protein